jgi:hypothetical protein
MKETLGSIYRFRFQGSSLTFEYGADRLTRNVGNAVPFYVAWSPRRAQIQFTQRRKPEMTIVTFSNFWLLVQSGFN